jgi:Fic family protein
MLTLQAPNNIQFDGATTDLIQDVRKLAEMIDQYRPLSNEVLDQIRKTLLEDRVYNSNAIEGSTIGLRETRAILAAGSIIDVGRRREATEVVNLAAAIQAVQKLVSDRKTWSDEACFLNVHRTLMQGLGDEHGGRVRWKSVMLTGAKYQPIGPEHLKETLAEFWKLLQESVDAEPIRLATWVHWAIARIHPFEDGNGRMARLWQDLILFGNHYTAAVIRASSRREYYTALSFADEGDFNPLAQLIGQALSSSLQSYLNACREHDGQDQWARELVGESHAVATEARKTEYLRWVRAMLAVLDAFQKCAAQITNASDGTITVQVKPFDIIDQPTWESLRTGIGASRTWFFWVNFRKAGNRLQYCFFFGHHFLLDADERLPELGPSVSLLISEQLGFGEAVRVDQIPDLPVSLRELVVLDGRIVPRMAKLTNGESEYQQDADPISIARTFMKQVLLSRLR